MRRGGAQAFTLVGDLHLAALLAVGVGEGDGGHAVFQRAHGAVQHDVAYLDGHGIVDLPVLLGGEVHVHPAVQGQKHDCAVLIHHVLNIGALGEINLLDTPILRHLEIRRGGIVLRQRGDFGFCGLKLRFQRFNGGLQGHGVNVQKRLPGGHGIARLHQRIRHRHRIVQRHVIRLADGQRARACDRLGEGTGGYGIFRVGDAIRGCRRHHPLRLIIPVAKESCGGQNHQYRQRFEDLFHGNNLLPSGMLVCCRFMVSVLPLQRMTVL